MKLPADHPERIELNDEVHARPPEPLVVPSRLSYLALLCDTAQREAGWLAVCALCGRYGVKPPVRSGLHFTAELGPFRLKWEQHTEFIRFMFIVEGTTGDPFERPAISVLPEDWVAALPGQLLVAAHAALIKAEPATIDPRAIGDRWFAGNMPAGASISGGAATALTDFRIHADGFSRHLLLDHATTPWQAGRVAHCSKSTPIGSWRCWRCRWRGPRDRCSRRRSGSWRTSPRRWSRLRRPPNRHC
jgi:uncharacterized membrane-anchored protein